MINVRHRKIYKYTSKTLVLEESIFTATTAEMQPEEIGARIISSKWSRRLWTLQEACMVHKTYFSFQDKDLLWQDLQRQISDRAKLNSWKKNAYQLSSGHPLIIYQKDPKYSLRDKLFDKALRYGTDMMFQEFADISDDANCFFALNPVWPPFHDFFQGIRFCTGRKDQISLHLTQARLRAVYYRDCTQRYDEAIVLASVMSEQSCSTSDLLEYQECRRMSVFFNSLEVIPEEVLFVDQELYEDEPNRWIPKTILSRHSPSALPFNKARGPDEPFLPSEKGLVCNCDGIKIHAEIVPKHFSFKYKGHQYSANCRRAGHSTVSHEPPNMHFKVNCGRETTLCPIKKLMLTVSLGS